MRLFAVAVAALALVCLVGLITIPTTSSQIELMGKGLLYGFHPDEMGVKPEDEKRAMDVLKQSQHAQIKPADVSERELKRWITPYFTRKMREKPEVYGNQRVPSAVDMEHRRIDLISEAEPRVSQHFKAAYDSSLPVNPIIRKGTQPDFHSASHPEISAAKATGSQDSDEWTETAARPPKIPQHVANQQADFFEASDFKPPATLAHVSNQQADFFAATGRHPTFESAMRHTEAKPASFMSTVQELLDHTKIGNVGRPIHMLPAAQQSLDSRSYASKARFTDLAAKPEKQLPPSWIPLFRPDREHGYWGPKSTEAPDAFAPQEPWGMLPESKKMAFAFADLQRECVNAGKGHAWDAEKHQCLFNGVPIENEAPPARDSSLDYQTADMERECLAMRAKHDGYAWDAEGRRCLLWGEPVRNEPQADVRPLAYKYQDLKRDCEQRGKDYYWEEPAVDGEVGACYRAGQKLRQRQQAPEWQTMDFVYSDVRSECEKRGWHWGTDGMCTKYGRGLADQDGYRKAKSTGTRRTRDPKYFLNLPSKWTDDSESAAATPPTVVGDRELPFTFTDFKQACADKKGVYKLLENPPRAVCLSQWECSVIDQHGYQDHNCERAGMDNLWATKVIATDPARALHRDAFSPGGSQEPPATGSTPPLSIASSVWEAQTGRPNPLPYQNADLNGKDLAKFVQGKPAGRGWTEGENHANGEQAKYYFNHESNQLVWKGPTTRPEQCTDEVNGTGEVPGCNWERNVDLASGEYYWTNLDSGKSTWQNPFQDKYPATLKLSLPTRKGTWSGTRGGNPYWTPVRTAAELGPSVKVANPHVQRLPNCGGSSGMCIGYAEGGAGPAEPPDAFNPQATMKGEPNRGVLGGEWDRATASEGGGQTEGGGGVSLAARQQSLADIYGVRIDDDDARRFFSQDDGADYKPPSHESTMAYVRYLARHPYHAPKEKPSTAVAPPSDADFEPQEEGADDKEKEEEAKWPEQAKFGLKHKSSSREEWCNWAGGGGQEVRCSIGKHGAWPDEPVSAGIWGHTEKNPHTMVGYGAWRIPKAALKRRAWKWPKGAIAKAERQRRLRQLEAQHA